MAYKAIPIPNSSKVIYWDESMSMKDNILANLEGVPDNEPFSIPGYIHGKHSAERLEHAKKIIDNLSEHSDAYLPVEVEESLETLPSHGKDRNPSLLYFLVQQAVRASTNNEMKRNQMLSQELNQVESQHQILSDENNTSITALRKIRNEKVESDTTLLEAKKDVEDLEKEALSLDDNLVALEKEMRTLGEKSTRLLMDRAAIKTAKDTEVIQYFQSKLTAITDSIESIPSQHENLVLRKDDLKSNQLAIVLSKKKLIDTLHKSIATVVEKLTSWVPPLNFKKNQGPGLFGGEPAIQAEVPLNQSPSVNQHEKKDFQDWDIKDNLWFNLQSTLTSYLNTGIHSPGRKKSAQSVLAKIRELQDMHTPDSELDRALLVFIREQLISSHGFNSKPSQLHTIYRNAELFIREREMNEIKSNQITLASVQESNQEITFAIAKRSEEKKKLQKDILENETQVQNLSQRKSTLEHNISAKNEKVTGLKELIALKQAQVLKEESINEVALWARVSSNKTARANVGELRQEILTQQAVKSELEMQLPSLTQEVNTLEKTIAAQQEENNRKVMEIRHHYLRAKQLSRKVEPGNPLTGDPEKYPITSLVKSAEMYVATLESHEKSPERKRAKTSTNPFDNPSTPVKPHKSPQSSDDETSEDTEESKPLSPDTNNPFAK